MRLEHGSHAPGNRCLARTVRATRLLLLPMFRGGSPSPGVSPHGCNGAKRNYGLEQLLSALTPKATVRLPNYTIPIQPDQDNTKGAVVRRFELGHQPAGYYIARTNAAYWNGRNASGESVASGVYFYQLRAGNYSAVRRMVIVK